uniref:Acyl-[acyl-carrier-protein] hydrolase n=1 Tax=Cucumis melo TaxID=3656 RepID=A0A9I9CL49_CUCME
MASFSCPVPYVIRCSTAKEGNDSNKLRYAKVNGAIIGSISEADLLSQSVRASRALVPSVAENGCFVKEDVRQKIPTKKQLVDPHRQGLIIEGGVGYRQTVVIRSYEVGPDKTATVESVMNLLQETALNHVWMSGLLSNGFGATHGMMRNNLIWVVSRMLVEVDHYPIWYVLYNPQKSNPTRLQPEPAFRGEIVEIDTWVGASGKNGMRRDWLIRSQATGHVYARATSTWVMMNQQTRRLSKMPEEVRAEISPWFIEKQAIKEDAPEKISKLNDKAKYMNSDLKTIPDHVLESHQLSSIILEYRRECGSSDIVQSLCEPDEDGILRDVEMIEDSEISLLNGFSLASEILKGGLLGSFDKGTLRYTHLLQIEGEAKNEEIVRGRTTWKKKLTTIPFSTQ